MNELLTASLPIAVLVTTNFKFIAKTVPAILILGGFLLIILGVGLNVSLFSPETGNALFAWRDCVRPDRCCSLRLRNIHL